jgi:hypothetical protein
MDKKGTNEKWVVEFLLSDYGIKSTGKTKEGTVPVSFAAPALIAMMM